VSTLFVDVSETVHRGLRQEARALNIPVDRLATAVLGVYAAEARRSRLAARRAEAMVGSDTSRPKEATPP